MTQYSKRSAFRGAFYLTFLLCIMIGLSGCANNTKPNQGSKGQRDIVYQQRSAPPASLFQSKVEQQLESMSLDEKIGQLFFVGIEGTKWNQATAGQLLDFPVGGIILFSRNIESPQQTLALTNQLKSHHTSPIPLWIGIDEEGGDVSRLPSSAFLPFPAAATFGQGDPEVTYLAGEATGSSLQALGINIDFAPVLDVNSEQNNPVIGSRAFSHEPTQVTEHALAFAEGLQEANVAPVGKHFPGHGDTIVDSHVALPIVNKSLEELKQLELVPFRAAIKDEMPAFMVGHLLVKNLDQDTPSSLSPIVIKHLLRDTLQFQGVIMTDDLTMEAILSQYTIAEATVKAIKAGNDVVLISHGSQNTLSAFQEVKKAVAKGVITEQQLNESVRRILRMKEQGKLTDEVVPPPDLKELNALRQKVLDQA
ncbi:beta-N-acetylhexosaminidase [Bacillaceae bacterium SIJ1]|uniref:beta-N-acetylhexosaminidase n=1 Tax=Litoribacterium kuwaitense TaxID=1398745 RepID=UPI0013EC7756|nr:beta-N-acetylhexosaminidase [Litoribacterium kuwaitense]NGP44826.1 beta-N-acetylhexosaminidase [Litoribacterium kuwaitense]